MGKYYVTELLEVLLRAGCQVEENEITDGWWERSRSSGGFDSEPLGVVWHHTASSTSPNNDLDYMINGSPDRPVGNVLLGRDGVFRPVAAGCANTQGKGGPVKFSRGTCPLDQGNTKLFAFEIANNGVGESWPQIQIDAAFKGSNALNLHWHNKVDDVVTHALGSGDGYTSRKIDPAVAAAVQGPWRPASSNTSGTWLLEDLKAECRRRAGSTPLPGPTPNPEDDMPAATLIKADDDPSGAVFWWDGKQIGWVRTGTAIDVGILTGAYFGNPPLSNFNKEEIQRFIESGWSGGPVPPGFNAPSAVDSSVT